MAESVYSQPSIFIYRSVALDQITRCLASVFEVPPAHVLVGGFPAGTSDADYTRYFKIGCVKLWRISGGVFGSMLEPFLSDHCLSDDRLAALSACLQSLICVDFSRSDSEPDEVVWLKGVRVGRVRVIEMEDAQGNPYQLSPQIDALMADQTGTTATAYHGPGC